MSHASPKEVDTLYVAQIQNRHYPSLDRYTPFPSPLSLSALSKRCNSTPLNLQSPPSNLRAPNAQEQRHRRHDQGHNCLKNQRPPHIPVLVFQRVHNHNEQAAQQLTARPADRRPDLGTDRIHDLDQKLQRHGHDHEATRPQRRADDVRGDDGAAGGSPDENEVADCDERDAGFDDEEEGLVAVDDGGDDGGGDETDDDQDGPGDPGFGLAVPVRFEDLVEEGGDGVEESDVDPEGEGEEEEGEGVRERAEGCEEGRACWACDGGLGVVGRGGWGCGWGGGDEEGWDGSDGGLYGGKVLVKWVERLQGLGTYDDGDVESHVWDVRGLVGPERVNQLTQRSSERVCETCHCRCRDSPLVAEP